MVTATQSASFVVQGQLPLADRSNPAYSNTLNADDLYSEIFVINPSTVATALDLSKIVTGTSLWVTTDHPVEVTLTQSTTDRTYIVDSFLFINATFTGIKLANTSATVAANVSINLTGNRAVVGPGPGIY